ncbi:MAG: undecaprenyldiphospho-muramoylpentapeptide beta-N-acetylglucosaminyltransferase [Kofleriaceae bacterium]
MAAPAGTCSPAWPSPRSCARATPRPRSSSSAPSAASKRGCCRSWAGRWRPSRCRASRPSARSVRCAACSGCRALWQARRLVKAFAPDAVIGVGGYASGPVVLMARLRGVPTAICEQNSIPGLTNKWLGRVVRRVFVSLPGSARFFAARKVVHSGNPLRRDLARRLTTSAEAPAAERALHVLVCGGSLGAVAVNALAAEALIALAGERPLTITHQTGERGLADTRARYHAAGVTADVRAFIDDMGAAYAAADVVVARAGATTVAELALAGRPTIFIPYPHAADDHQTHNARGLVEAGAALSLPQATLTGPALADALRPLLAEPARRAAMAGAMHAQARPDAAATVIDWFEAQPRR